MTADAGAGPGNDGSRSGTGGGSSGASGGLCTDTCRLVRPTYQGLVPHGMQHRNSHTRPGYGR